jgi:hypothetical protein
MGIRSPTSGPREQNALPEPAITQFRQCLIDCDDL